MFSQLTGLLFVLSGAEPERVEERASEAKPQGTNVQSPAHNLLAFASSM